MDNPKIILQIDETGRLEYDYSRSREIIDALMAAALTQGQTKPNGEPFGEGEKLNQIIGTVQAYLLGWIRPEQRESAVALYNTFLKAIAEDVDNYLKQEAKNEKRRPIRVVQLRPQDKKEKPS